MNKFTYPLLGAAILMPAAATAVPLSGATATFIDFSINGTTSAIRPELGGIILEDVTTNFTISGAGENLSGTIQNRVIRSDDGTIDFSWRIFPTSGTGDISAFRVGGFEGYSLDADWRIDGLGDVAPDIARYFGDGSGKVNFLFSNDEVGNAVTGGYETSRFFFLDTDALHYDMSGQFDLLCADTGCISDLYTTFAPAVVPVPAAVWLFGSGMLGLLGLARRKAA